MISGISTWNSWRNDEHGGIVFYGALTKARRVVYSSSVARGDCGAMVRTYEG